jgi:hypothetical protein
MRKRLDEMADRMGMALKPPAGQQTTGKEPTDRAETKDTKEDLIKTSKRKQAQSVEKGSDTVQLNPPHGAKDDFDRMSITLPPEMRQRLLDESNRRKKERLPDWSISVIVREALSAYLK